MLWRLIAQRIERTLDLAVAALLAVMVLSLAFQVFCRYVLNWSPNWSEEVARFVMVWITLLASAAVLRSGSHIAVTALVSAAPPRVRRVLLVLRDLAILVTVGLLAITGWQFTAMNASQESPAMEISMAVPYAALVVGSVLMAVLLCLSRLAGETIPLSDGGDAGV